MNIKPLALLLCFVIMPATATAQRRTRPATAKAAPSDRPPAWPLQLGTRWRTSLEAESYITLRNDHPTASIKEITGAVFLLDAKTHEDAGGPAFWTFQFSKPIAPGSAGNAALALDDKLLEMKCAKFSYEPFKNSVNSGFFSGKTCTKQIFLIDIRRIKYADGSIWEPTGK
ncbi:MAG TPA: hypothetical protein VJX74_14575 [Blastocatellia bacterium]|nr:hypothetical protein [Blastocatellia bacterium]